MIEKNHISVWDGCLSTIKKYVNPQSYKTWFEPIRPVNLSGNVLTIQVPNKFFFEWLEEHYVAELKMAMREQLGEGGRLEYQILMPNHDKKIPQSGLTPTTKRDNPPPYQNEIPTEQIKNPFVIPGIKKVKISPNLNSKLTFDNFIEGDCNRLARSAGVAVSKKPGGTAFNPLFLYGDSGLGKTHLVHAIGNQVLQGAPDKTVLYVSCEEFTNQIINAIRNNAVQDFVRFYQMVDVLMVDDIQFLANKNKMQEIFFHIFNTLHQSGKQIVLTSDRPPKDLEGIQDRLISRFKWGLSADLQIPEFETRIAIFQTKMSGEGLEIPSNVIEFICYNIKDNIRELEGVLVSLIAQSTLNRRGIDMDLAKSVIKDFVRNISKEITVDFIQQLVAEHFNVSVDKLQGKTRKRQVVIARQLSMYLAKKLTNKSLKAIGENFGGRDHSTVIYSCKAVQDLLDTDMIFKDTVTDLEKKIKMNLHE